MIAWRRPLFLLLIGFGLAMSVERAEQTPPPSHQPNARPDSQP